MSTLTGGSENKNIDALNMANGQYETKLFTIDAYNHLTGNSDDIIDGTGVFNINLANVNYINNIADLKFTAPDGFKWEFVKVNRTAPFYDPN